MRGVAAMISISLWEAACGPAVESISFHDAALKH